MSTDRREDRSKGNVSLKNDSSIYVMKPDKGNGVLVIDRDDYTKKMEDILSGKDKF